MKKIKKAKGKPKIELNLNYSLSPQRHLSLPKPPYPSCIANSNVPLQPHQLRVVSFLNKPDTRGIIVVHDVGTGKTLLAVTATQCFLSQSDQHHVIVVTPTSLVGNFKKEIVKYGADSQDARYSFYTIQGFKNAVESNKIKNLENSLLILDEAHNIRTDQEFGDVDVNEEDEDVNENEEEVEVKKPKRIGVYAKALIDTAVHCKKVICLTATPLINHPSDIVNLIAMINGDEKPIEPSELYKIKLPEYLRCKTSFYKPSEEEYLSSYPRTKTIEKCIVMEPAYLEQYINLERNGSAADRAFCNGLRRASNTFDMVYSQKVNWIVNEIQNNKGKKYVIFSHFIKTGINLLMKKLEEINVQYRHITGSIPQKERDKSVVQYNNNDIQVLLISKAGGEGLDLKNTHGVILMEPCWNESAIKQIIGRAVRKNSHISLPEPLREVNIYRLYLIKPSELAIVPKIMNELWIKNKDRIEEKLSIDLMMRNVSMLKQVEIDRFISFMKKYSIEQKLC